MKNVGIILFLIILSFSCQEDDVCVDNASSNLVLKIYNEDSISIFLDTLYITYKNSDNIEDTLKLTSVDSAQIPLRIDNGPIGFGFITSLSTNQKDSLAMAYTPKNEFASKACGLKKIYENVSYSQLETYRIQRFRPLTETISNSNEVHLILFY